MSLLEDPTFRAALKVAIEVDDARRIGTLVDKARFRGHDYAQLCQLAGELTGMEAADWDVLMQQADECDAIDDYGDGNGCPGCGGSCQTACR